MCEMAEETPDEAETGPQDGGTGPPSRRAIAIGASAGGIEALLELVPLLEPGLAAPVLVTVHQPAAATTVLPQLLARRGRLPVGHAQDGETLLPGRVYVAPPDRHLMVDKGRVVLSSGPKENGNRPAIDPLFRSLALDAGAGAVGVVLSGALDDGASGALEVVRHGGTVMIQEPDEALYPSMPLATLEQVPGAFVRPVAGLGAILPGVVDRAGPLRSTGHGSARLRWEVAIARMEGSEMSAPDAAGTAAGLACPDCSGPLFEIHDGGLPRYRCRVGHAWSQHALGAQQEQSVETALYMALRALEDKAALQRRIAATAAEQGADRVVARARAAADEAVRSARVLRRLLGGAGDEDRGRSRTE
ncbi:MULTISPECIES: chemotaxis protein CheB [unclassified Pseudonocardia]|uniref:chemotaxis protein CheB n=1 Tax=unclassified Pseudonocardia TaxID=2619320 RepID=UPI0009FAECF6|nr:MULTISPECIES: chemotaxis protein CheB [unclassified Pseudonocardia]